MTHLEKFFFCLVPCFITNVSQSLLLKAKQNLGTTFVDRLLLKQPKMLLLLKCEESMWNMTNDFPKKMMLRQIGWVKPVFYVP